MDDIADVVEPTPERIPFVIPSETLMACLLASLASSELTTAKLQSQSMPCLTEPTIQLEPSLKPYLKQAEKWPM